MIASGLLLAAGVAGFIVYRKMTPPEQLPATTGQPSTGTNTQNTVTNAINTLAPVVQQAVQRVSKYPEGTLLRHGSNDKVFVIDALGYRRYISSRSYFDANGYNMASVKSISLAEMVAIPEGARLGALAGFSRN